MTTCVVDSDPTLTGEGDSLEKVADYFSKPQNSGVPDIILGHGIVNGSKGGMDIYVANGSSPCGGWTKYHIGNGDFYERSKPIWLAGHRFADLIASVSQRVLLFHNPLNQGASSVNALWTTTVINPNEGCHDLRLADLDGDGLMDVMCSSSSLRNNSPPFLAFQNANGSWSVTSSSTAGITAGDGIAALAINGGPQNNIVSCDPGSGNLYWYENPGGAAARTSKWASFHIGACNQGVSLDTATFSGTSQSVVVASNEQAWSPGMVLYTATSNPQAVWNSQSLDSTTRDVHQLNAVSLAGTPGFLRAEQEQASSVCNTQNLNNHPSVSGCRVDLWLYNNGSWNVTSLYSGGSHNPYCTAYNGGLLCTGANHHLYGGSPTLFAWIVTTSTGGGGINPGLYTITDQQGFAIDGGFLNYLGTTTEMLYKLSTSSNPYQGWQISANGTVCNEKTPSACLSDGGQFLQIGVGSDNWTFAASGAGFTVQNTRTKAYIANALTPANNAPVPMSATPSVWNFNPIGGSGFAPGTYSLDDPNRQFTIDGGFFYWARQNNAEIYHVTHANVFQQWMINTSGSGYTICNKNNTAWCLSDSGSNLQIAVRTDTFTIAASGAGFTILDNRTQNFINLPNSLTDGATVPTSKTPYVFNIGSPQ